MDLFDPPVCRVIDVECTGLGSDAEVCEVGWFDIYPRQNILGTGGSYLCRVDHMPPDTRAVHHIRASDTRGFPPYDRAVFYEEAVRAGAVAFAAYNVEMEQKFLPNGLPIYCLYKAALRMYPEAPKHSLMAVLYWLEDQGRADLSGLAMPPHRAGPDAHAAAILMRTMIAENASGPDFHKWTQEPRIMPTVPIDKRWRGKPWSAPDRGWLEWVLNTIYDDPDLRWNVARELDRRDEVLDNE